MDRSKPAQTVSREPSLRTEKKEKPRRRTGEVTQGWSSPSRLQFNPTGRAGTAAVLWLVPGAWGRSGKHREAVGQSWQPGWGPVEHFGFLLKTMGSYLASFEWRSHLSDHHFECSDLGFGSSLCSSDQRMKGAGVEGKQLPQ